MFNQYFQKLFNKIINLPVQQPKRSASKKRSYNLTGAASWPGFVPPSTAYTWQQKARHVNIFRAHNGSKECARCVAQGNAGWCYAKA